ARDDFRGVGLIAVAQRDKLKAASTVRSGERVGVGGGAVSRVRLGPSAATTDSVAGPHPLGENDHLSTDTRGRGCGCGAANKFYLGDRVPRVLNEGGADSPPRWWGRPYGLGLRFGDKTPLGDDEAFD